MGFYIECFISIKAFTPEACEKVKEINLEEYNLTGSLRNRDKYFSYSGSTEDPFEARRLIKDIVDVLDGEGRASVTYKCTEDIAEAYTYFYLGDGIKAAYFSSGEYADDICWYDALYAALSRFSPDELKKIYREVMDEKCPKYLEKDHDGCREEICGAIRGCVMDRGEKYFSTPQLAKVLDVIKDNSKKARFDDEDLALFDYKPCIDWEEKGFYTFSKTEKEYFRK